MPSAVVLDTNVLSSFDKAGWLTALAIWPPDTTVVVSEMVWEEFQDYTNITQPDWLSVSPVNLEDVKTRAPGTLALADWSCIALTEASDDAQLVTNDQAMHTVAERRDLSYEWGTKFLLRTFQRCGLDKTQLENGIDVYAEDLGLPREVVTELRTAKKDI